MDAIAEATRTPTFPTPPTPVRSRRRPTRVGYAWAMLIALLGVGAGVAWGLTTYVGMQRQIDGFVRTAIPGEVTIRVAEPGGRVLYYEGLGEMPLVALDVRIIGPDGDPIPVGTYGADLRYDGPGSSLGHAVGTFDARASGSYLITAAGEAPVGATLAIGKSIPATTFVAIVGAVALTVAALAAAAGLAIVTAMRRR